MNATNISSDNRVSKATSTTSSFRVPLDKPLTKGRYRLDSVQLVNGTYNVSEHNNTIRYLEAGELAYVSASVTPGNYDTITLPPALKTALEAVASAAVFTVTYNETTGKITIASTVAYTIDNSYKPESSLLPYLGFHAVDDAVTAASQTGGGVLYLSYPQNIFLKLNDEFASLYSTPGHQDQYVAQIPATGGFQTTLFQTSDQYSSELILTRMIKSVTVSLYDGQGRLLPNGNAPVSFTLVYCGEF